MFGISMSEIIPTLLDNALILGYRILSVAMTVVVGLIVLHSLRVAIGHLETMLIRSGEKKEDVPGSSRKRMTTLTGVLQTISVGVVWSVVIVISLAQLGLNIGPILAGAGIIGLAVGFGAQNLVRDVISGFFIILENQIRIGDVAIINGTGGLVEAVSFRTVVLRDLSATVHVFPNGTINTLANMTMGWSAYVIDMGVAYKEDTDRVVGVMQQVDEEMRADPKYGPSMLEPIEIMGVDKFADSAVVIKVRLKTRPIRQWFVGREYNRRIKMAFDAAGIEIPFPHRTLYMGEASQPFDVLLNEATKESLRPEGDRERI